MIESLHHLTATVDRARPDLSFYADLLGLRLVKKTVNFDNHFVYHFYYGDELGRPSTLMTTFPYHGWNVPRGVHGAGQITTTSFSVPAASLGFWERRLAAHGTVERGERFGAGSLAVRDPSGLRIEVVADSDDDREPWRIATIDPAMAVRGLASATLRVREPARTVEFLRDVLGFRETAAAEGIARMVAGVDRPGHRLDVLQAGSADPDAANGIGTVHHVALAIADAGAQATLRARLESLGVNVTRVLDRKYFRSIYFREPGGVLLEVATVGPGFTVDEPAERLGERLELPDWEETNRSEIEARLEPLA